MRTLWIGFLTLAPACALFGQLDLHTVTITASRQTTAPLDRAQFSLSVNTGVGAGLDDVVGALHGIDVGPSNLASVYTQTIYVQNQSQNALQWTFSLSVPFSAIKDTFTSLAQIQQSIAKQNNGFSFSYTLQGAGSSQASNPPACSIPDLLADARAQAQKLADAAGFFLGPVLNLASGSASVPVPVPYAAGIIGATISTLAQRSAFILPPTQQVCSLVVQFRLN